MTKKSKAVDFDGQVSLWIDEDGQANVGLRGSHLSTGIRVGTKASGGAGKEIARQIDLTRLRPLNKRLAPQDIRALIDVETGNLTLRHATGAYVIESESAINLHMHAQEVEPTGVLAYRLAAAAISAIDALDWHRQGAVIDNTLVSYLIRMVLAMPQLRIDPDLLVLDGGDYTIRPQMVDGQLGLLTRGANVGQLNEISRAFTHMFATSWHSRIILPLDAESMPGVLDRLTAIDGVIVPRLSRESQLTVHTQTATMNLASGRVRKLTQQGSVEPDEHDLGLYNRVQAMIEADQADQGALGLVPVPSREVALTRVLEAHGIDPETLGLDNKALVDDLLTALLVR